MGKSKSLFKSQRSYSMVSFGPGRQYPMIRLPKEMNFTAGKSYMVEVFSDGSIELRPVK